jgi:hypothetical protein
MGGWIVRVSVVYDNEGNILAATEAGEQADQFVLQEGEEATEFDVPEELAAGGVRNIVENLRIEPHSKKLIQP